MADHEESLIEKIAEKIHDHDSSSSSDSDNEKSSPSSVKSKIFHLFGRDKPLHQVLRVGILAIIFLLKIQSTGGRQLYVADKVDPQNGPPAPRAQYPNHH